MAQEQFLHISFEFKGQVNTEGLKQQFDLALDWIHYLPNCWIVKTTSDAAKWSERLKPYIGPNDSMFICRVDLSERQGWLSKWIWEWIQKHQAKSG